MTLLLELAGAYAFFGGLMGILRECGAADALARTMEKPLLRLPEAISRKIKTILKKPPAHDELAAIAQHPAL